MWGKKKIFIIEMIGADKGEVQKMRDFLGTYKLNVHVVTHPFNIIKVK